MNETLKKVKILNNLLKANTSRSEFYRKAYSNISDPGLLLLFNEHFSQSMANIIMLSREINHLGRVAEPGLSFGQKIFQAVVDVWFSLVRNHRNSTLALCSWCEQEFYHTYQNALNDHYFSPSTLMNALIFQQENIRQAGLALKKTSLESPSMAPEH